MRVEAFDAWPSRLPARVVAGGLGFPEGPAVLPDGSLLVVEIARGRLSRVDPSDGAVTTVAELGGGPNGVALGPDGAAYVTNNGGMVFEEVDGRHLVRGLSPDYTGGSIQRVDPETGSWETLHDSYDGHRLAGPNDIVFAADGSYWFTDQPRKHERHRDWGAVYRARPDGELERAVARLDDPNGIGISPDGERLYVAETNPGRVWAWGLGGAGDLVPLYRGSLDYLSRGGELVGRTEAFQYFDSMAVTADGRVVVGTLGEPGGLTVFDPASGARHFVTLDGVPDETFVTNVCFGGPAMRTAYITLSLTGLLVAVDWPTPGQPLAF